MTDALPDRQRFHELLPFYVNGTLDSTEQQWMEVYLAAHPDADASLQFVKRLSDVVQATRSSIPEQQRLDKLLHEFRKTYPRRSFLGRLADWFAHPHHVPAPAIVFVALLVIAQGVALIGLMPNNGEQPDLYRGMAIKCDDGPRIRAVFRPEAAHAEVLILLRKVEARVTDGPSETGELWVRIPKGRSIDEALALLKSSAMVDEAIIVEAKGCPK